MRRPELSKNEDANTANISAVGESSLPAGDVVSPSGNTAVQVPIDTDEINDRRPSAMRRQHISFVDEAPVTGAPIGNDVLEEAFFAIPNIVKKAVWLNRAL